MSSQSQAAKALSTALDRAVDCVIGADAEGRIVYFNHAAEQTFGYRSAETLGRTVAELIVPERLQEAHQSGLRQAADGGRATLRGRRVRMPALRADGSEFPVELTIVESSSETMRFVAFIRDLSEVEELRYV